MSTETPTIQQQIALLKRGCEGLYTEELLTQRLTKAAEQGRQLRIKLGMDPTAPDIHLGHTVVLRKMRQFQDLGHKAVLIIGDYTAKIGDPTGRDTTRPILSDEQIAANAQTYLDQANKILRPEEEFLEVRYNSEWLSNLKFADVLRLTGMVTVQQMLQRDNFKKRIQAEKEIMISEFMYPLMQGYDSVVIESDVELGGTDQTFNNLVGRDLQKAFGKAPQIVLTMPILVGLDGTEKMSKSKGNYIGVTDEPNDMFGKVMSIPDALMENYFTLLTDLPAEQIATMSDCTITHPRQAKAELGKMIVTPFYSDEAGEAAAAEFDRVFKERNVPTDMPEIKLPAGAMGIIELITMAGFASSKKEARRLVQQNAVSINEEKIPDINAEVTPANGAVLKVGKRRFGKLVIQ